MLSLGLLGLGVKGWPGQAEQLSSLCLPLSLPSQDLCEVGSCVPPSLPLCLAPQLQPLLLTRCPRLPAVR